MGGCKSTCGAPYKGARNEPKPLDKPAKESDPNKAKDPTRNVNARPNEAAKTGDKGSKGAQGADKAKSGIKDSRGRTIDKSDSTDKTLSSTSSLDKAKKGEKDKLSKKPDKKGTVEPKRATSKAVDRRNVGAKAAGKSGTVVSKGAKTTKGMVSKSEKGDRPSGGAVKNTDLLKSSQIMKEQQPQPQVAKSRRGDTRYAGAKTVSKTAKGEPVPKRSTGITTGAAGAGKSARVTKKDTVNLKVADVVKTETAPKKDSAVKPVEGDKGEKAGKQATTTKVLGTSKATDVFGKELSVKIEEGANVVKMIGKKPDIGSAAEVKDSKDDKLHLEKDANLRELDGVKDQLAAKDTGLKRAEELKIAGKEPEVKDKIEGGKCKTTDKTTPEVKEVEANWFKRLDKKPPENIDDEAKRASVERIKKLEEKQHSWPSKEPEENGWKGPKKDFRMKGIDGEHLDKLDRRDFEDKTLATLEKPPEEADKKDNELKRPDDDKAEEQDKKDFIKSEETADVDAAAVEGTKTDNLDKADFELKGLDVDSNGPSDKKAAEVQGVDSDNIDKVDSNKIDTAASAVLEEVESDKVDKVAKKDAPAPEGIVDDDQNEKVADKKAEAEHVKGPEIGEKIDLADKKDAVDKHDLGADEVESEKHDDKQHKGEKDDRVDSGEIGLKKKTLDSSGQADKEELEDKSEEELRSDSEVKAAGSSGKVDKGEKNKDKHDTDEKTDEVDKWMKEVMKEFNVDVDKAIEKDKEGKKAPMKASTDKEEHKQPDGEKITDTKGKTEDGHTIEKYEDKDDKDAQVAMLEKKNLANVADKDKADQGVEMKKIGTKEKLDKTKDEDKADQGVEMKKIETKEKLDKTKDEDNKPEKGQDMKMIEPKKKTEVDGKKIDKAEKTDKADKEKEQEDKALIKIKTIASKEKTEAADKGDKQLKAESNKEKKIEDKKKIDKNDKTDKADAGGIKDGIKQEQSKAGKSDKGDKVLEGKKIDKIDKVEKVDKGEKEVEQKKDQIKAQDGKVDKKDKTPLEGKKIDNKEDIGKIPKDKEQDKVPKTVAGAKVAASAEKTDKGDKSKDKKATEEKKIELKGDDKKATDKKDDEQLKGGQGKEQRTLTGADAVSNNKRYQSIVNEKIKSLKEKLRNCKVMRAQLSDFTVIAFLGDGAFGQVLHVKHTGTQMDYAMKVQSKQYIMKVRGQRQRLMSEKNILSALDFVYVVKLFFCFQDNACVYLVLDLSQGGDFFDLRGKGDEFSEDAARFYIGQVLLALEYLHGANIVYRDLKPENMLVSTTGYVKLTDFGYAKVLTGYTYTFCGTPEYIAPEVITMRGYGNSPDWWTLGILIHEIVYNATPFYAKQVDKVYQRIRNSYLSLPPHRKVSSTLTNLLHGLLEKQVAARYGCLRDGADDIKKHPWFSKMDWLALYERRYPAPIRPKLFEGKPFNIRGIPKSNKMLYEEDFAQF